MDASQWAAEDPRKRSWFQRISMRGRNAASPTEWLPSFFVVVPPRTGTSWLYEMLQSHVSEIAPTYFASVEARKRIARLIPSARVVCIFRDPVERLLSLYRLKRAYG